jgi:hypothetical protein
VADVDSRQASLTPPSGPQSPSRIPAPLAALAVFGATLAAYLPAVRGGLLWDDAAHITAPGLRSLGGLWRIWFKLGTTQQYYPVLHSAFWLEHRIWGDSLPGYHLANIGLHAAAACLFALVLARIRPAGVGFAGSEWLAAAVFALHPVCVESVAWISEQKNTLSLVFYLLSALAYLRFDRERRRWPWYWAALALFILALLSKSVTATLPAALLLMVAWRRGRLSCRGTRSRCCRGSPPAPAQGSSRPGSRGCTSGRGDRPSTSASPSGASSPAGLSGSTWASCSGPPT